MERKLLLIGGGGHCRSVADSIFAMGIYDSLGIIDNKESVPGVPVIGNDDDLPLLFREGWKEAVITVGSVGDTTIRRRLYDKAKGIGFILPTIIDPTSSVAVNVKLGEGCFIGKRAVINTGAQIGICSIINTGTIVEHDCEAGDFVHLSPGSVLCGQVKVGDDSHIGAGTVVRQQITIGRHALIGIGSVVVKDIPDGRKAYGNPCRVVG